MAKSPFTCLLPFNQQQVYAQADRQESFENRVIESIFKLHGISTPKLRMLAKRLNAGTPMRTYTMDWFNSQAGYPVKFAACRFAGKRKYMEIARAMRLGRQKFDNEPEYSALVDLRDSYPGEAVAFIGRYPDWADDIVFHFLDLTLRDGEYRFQRRFGDFTLTVERLGAFIARYDDWDISTVFSV